MNHYIFQIVIIISILLYAKTNQIENFNANIIQKINNLQFYGSLLQSSFIQQLSQDIALLQIQKPKALQFCKIMIQHIIKNRTLSEAMFLQITLRPQIQKDLNQFLKAQPLFADYIKMYGRKYLRKAWVMSLNADLLRKLGNIFLNNTNIKQMFKNQKKNSIFLNTFYRDMISNDPQLTLNFYTYNVGNISLNLTNFFISYERIKPEMFHNFNLHNITVDQFAYYFDAMIFDENNTVWNQYARIYNFTIG